MTIAPPRELAQQRNERPGRHPDPLHVHAHHAVPFALGDILEAPLVEPGVDRGVVDEHVGAAERITHLGRHLGRRCRVGHVELAGVRFAAGLDDVRNCFRGCIVVDVGRQDPGTRRSKRGGERTAEATGCTRHHDAPAVQAEGRHSSSFTG